MSPIKQRDIVTCILLTIFTCGIYGIIWFISLTDDMRIASGDERLSGGKALLLTIITCGIYSFYWAYLMGKAQAVAKAKRGLNAEDNSVLYIILHIFGLSIVTHAIVQNELNNMATTPTNEQGA